MECNIGFYFFQKFDKSVNTFVNARDMHVFSNIRNKIQVKDDDNGLSIGKKFDKSSEAERKEAYEKASLEHDQSKDKQDIFLDNNPKDADEIIKAMTPENLTQEQMKLLEINDRTNHSVQIKIYKLWHQWASSIPSLHPNNHQFVRRACSDVHKRNPRG